MWSFREQTFPLYALCFSLYLSSRISATLSLASPWSGNEPDLILHTPCSYDVSFRTWCGRAKCHITSVLQKNKSNFITSLTVEREVQSVTLQVCYAATILQDEAFISGMLLEKFWKDPIKIPMTWRFRAIPKINLKMIQNRSQEGNPIGSEAP